MSKSKTVKVSDNELQENFVIKNSDWAEGYLKIVSIDDTFIFCVPFKEVKDRIFSGVRERNNFYKTIASKFRKKKWADAEIEIFGKHLSNLEKKAEEKIEKKEQKELKQEIAEESKEESKKLSLVEEKFEDLKKELIKNINDKIESVVDTLKSEGKNYGCSYVSYTFSEVAQMGVKTLGEKKLRFVFELDNKLVFMKEQVK